MTRKACVLLSVLAFFIGTSCEGSRTLQTPAAEKVDSFSPNLPAVPNVPPPRFPLTYPDGSYSVYGARKKIDHVVDTDITVTGYIVAQYEAPVCPEGRTCPPPAMPHLWLADDKDEKDQAQWLTVVGYANSQQDMLDQKENDEKGKKQELPEGVYLPPVVYDWQTGQKYSVKGTFTRVSGTGFLRTDGLLDYMEHKCLDCPAEPEEE